MNVVGIDASLTGTGLCVKRGALIELKTVKTAQRDFPDDLSRLRHIVTEITGRVPQDVGMVCIEDFFTPVNVVQMGSALKIVMLGALVRMALYERKVPFAVVSPLQVKKYVLGKGVGKKSLILREVYRRWGVEAKDDNQADACVLAHIAESLLLKVCGETLELTKPQADVVKVILADRPKYNFPSFARKPA